MKMKLWPSRTNARAVEPVTDLDAIVAEPVPFRFGGKIHFIKPVLLDEFLKFSNAQATFSNKMNDDVLLTPTGLAEQYHKVISSVCDTISLKDVLKMEQAQVAALYQLVLDAVTGQVDTGDGKKKRKKVQIYDSAQRSSLPSAPESSDGQLRKR